MFLKTMTEPIIANDEGVNVKPELMEKEKLYHCIYCFSFVFHLFLD